MNRREIGKLFSSKGLTWLLLLLVLLLNFSIRWRLRGLPLERDEGEYAYAGQLILQGIPPYQTAWNMKFPGAYFAYAGLMSCFGQSTIGIHCGLILVSSLSIVLIFLIGRELMDAAGGLLAAFFFALLGALPFTYGLAAHTTHFVVLFVSLGVYALLKMEKGRPSLWAFVAGLAFGCAILMKQHAVIFAYAAAAALLWRARSQKLFAFRGAAIFVIATTLPLLLICLGLASAGVWDRFYFWTIQYAREYVSFLAPGAAPRQFATGFGPILDDGMWVWGLGLLASLLVFLPGPGRRAAIFGTAWLLTGLAATLPGFYFRGHYFLMVMPGLALLNAALLRAPADPIRRRAQGPILRMVAVCLFLAAGGDLFLRNAAIWFQYPTSQVGRLLYGSNPFPESAEIAGYLAGHTQPGDTIAVLGSEPQIYFLSGRHAATGYLYVYPLTEPRPGAAAMRAEFMGEIETNRPAYVVYVNSVSSWVSTIIPGQTSKAIDTINNWWQAYAATSYQLAGEIDIPQAGPSQFFWDQQIADRTNTTPATISVFRRNKAP